MSRTRLVEVADLPRIVEEDPNPTYLLGDHGGRSLITGPVAPSSLIPGTARIETEHGDMYLDLESDVEIGV